MPKMTTEQFLSQLGIEVGKPFNVKGKRLDGKYIIVYFEETEGCIEHYSVFDFNMNDYEDGYGNSLEVLLDCEITPLPKFTLTDDEKDFVRIATISVFGRNKLGELFYTDYKGNQSLLPIDNHLFPFLKIGERCYLDELRRCL